MLDGLHFYGRILISPMIFAPKTTTIFTENLLFINLLFFFCFFLLCFFCLFVFCFVFVYIENLLGLLEG